MICGERFHDDVSLEITSADAAKITIAYCHLESRSISLECDGSEDLTSSKKFELLRQKLGRLKALRIHWIDASAEYSRFSVNHFLNLEYLQLENCPASTIIGSFSEYREQLKMLDISNSQGLNLSRLFLPWKRGILPLDFPPMTLSHEKNVPNIAQCWLSLKSLRVSNCGLTKLDISLHFLPAVSEVDFSHNSISDIVHFQDCSRMNILDLSYNNIRVLSNISRVLGNISSLYISNNQIQSLHGIDKLYSLRTLDVSNNLIDDFNELTYLTKLPCLEFLHLIGNPISLPKIPKTVTINKGKEIIGTRSIGNNITKSGVKIIMAPIAIVFYRRLVFKYLSLDGNILGAGRALPILDHYPISNAQRQSLRGLVFRNIDTIEKENSYILSDRKQSPLASMIIRGNWKNLNTFSPFAQLRTSSNMTTAENSSDEGSVGYSFREHSLGCHSLEEHSLDENHFLREDHFLKKGPSSIEKERSMRIKNVPSPSCEGHTWCHSPGNLYHDFYEESIDDELLQRRKDSSILRKIAHLDEENHPVVTLKQMKANLAKQRTKKNKGNAHLRGSI